MMSKKCARVLVLLMACIVSGVSLSDSTQPSAHQPASDKPDALTQDPMMLLSRMCEAMNQTSFSGTLVYLHDDTLESMKISKSYSDIGQSEKIYSLNGEAREVIRKNDILMCIIPNARKMTVESKKQSQLPFLIPHDLDNVKSYYDVSYQGDARVADMDSYLIQLTPKDSYRYGYRLWIDKKYNMLLKSDVLGEQGTPLEQMMFTQLNVVDSLPEQAFAPNAKSSAYERINIVNKNAQTPNQQMLHWRLNKAPMGFAVVSHNRMESGVTGYMVEHLFLSDGMASVSVFVEPKSGDAFEGASRIGALNAFGAVKSGYKVVTVGAVPPVTVRLINQNVVLAE